ncbi:unnamed protein product [Alopecurus aequalis]
MAEGRSRRTTRVGRYELGRTIGEGSFAKVKIARDTRDGSTCAIKVLDRDHVLRHSMVEQVTSKMLGEDEARRYFHQLINAVDYCHSRGVYHRDLKPENLLLDSYGNLKVSDFGLSALALQTKEDGLLHTACGTPNYVAPEVLADKGYDGKAADVWSCGIILFVLMTGSLPFDDPNLMTLYKMISRANVDCPSWLSAGARNLIKRIIDPNPQTRITIAEMLEDEWFKKDYKPPHFEQSDDVSLEDVDAAFDSSEEHLVAEKREKPESMNAFALIARSQGFNLGNLFEKEMMGMVKRETSFASQRTPQEIMSKIEDACGPLGFNVRKQNYKMKLKGDKTGRKGHLSVATEVFEVAPSLHMVELRKTGGDTLEFHSFYKSFSTELKDIVWKAESDTITKQTR